MKLPVPALAVTLLLSMLAGCASNPTTDSDGRACAQNFNVEGSSLSPSGTQYTNFMFFPGVSQKIAMDRASKQIALDGLNVNVIDREGGMITATNPVIAGKGSVVPLVVLFEPQKGGVTVRLKFSTGFGQVATNATVRDGFCRILTAVEGK